MSEVDQQTQLQPGGSKIILDLRTMLISQAADSFQFQHDLVMADEIRLELAFEGTAFVAQGEFRLSFEWDISQTKFNLQTFLIH